MQGTDRVRLKSLSWMEISDRMKEDLKNPPNKVEGSFAADNIQAVAKEIAKYYDYVDWLVDMHFAETATGEFLDAKAKEVGVFRRTKTKATGIVTFNGKPNTFIPAGFRVYAGEKVFYTRVPAYIGQDGSVDVEVLSENEGLGTNAGAFEVTSFTHLAGLESVENTEPITGGADIEDDESLRERTLLKMRYPGTSGNKYHYMHWAMEVDGVGRVKVFPLWEGPGTVKVSILDSNQKPAKEDLIEKVGYHIDHGGERDGEALAPIGAYLTVDTAKAKKIDIKGNVDLEVGTSKSKDMIANELKEDLQAYIDSEISYKKNRLTVAKVIDLCYSIPGVSDIVSLTIDGATDSVEIGEEEVFEVSEVVLS